MLLVRPDPDATDETPRIILRGQVLPLGEASDRFLFAVGPAITDMDRLASWNLTFSDFAIGDPRNQRTVGTAHFIGERDLRLQTADQ